MDSRRENELNAVVTRYFQAKEKGESFDSDAVLRQHPDLADDLRSFFAAQSQVAKAAEHLKQNYDPTSATIGAEAGPMPTVVRYFGDYEILEEIARGGMGVVYKARQVSLNRVVALKMILAGQLASKGDVQRFRQEAEAAANLDHPNILPIHEVGEHQGQQYFSMKLVEGGSLANRIDALKADPKAAAALMSTLAKAVHYAHQRGILHRDLKPANILLDKDGTPYVTDFGLAKKVQGESSVTQSGAVVGTPSYMPPEQARGAKDISTSADVYSLGAILYELLTGKPPFKADSVFATVKQVMEAEAADPKAVNPDVERDLSVIAMKCLRKDPAARYHSAGELADDLDRWRRREAILARPVGRMERFNMWIKRNPAVAGLALALWTALCAGTVMSVRYANRANIRAAEAILSEREKTLAYDQARDLSTALQGSLSAEKRASYFAKVNLAFNEWQLNNPLRAERLLDETDASERGWEYAFLRRVMHPERCTQDVDSRGLAVLAYTPDGKRVVTAGFDERLRVWNATDGRLVVAIAGHSAPVLCVAFSADGKRMLASSGKETILWETETGKRLPWLGPTAGTMRLAWHADGRLATTQKDKKISLFPVDSDKPLWTAPGSMVAWVEGGFVASCVEDRVALYDPATGKEAASLKVGGAPVKAFVVSADGKRLATTYGATLANAGDARVVVWDVPARKILFDQKVMGFEFALDPTGKILAVGGQREVRFWNVDGGDERTKLRGLSESVHNLAFAPDGSSFTAVASDAFGGILKEDPDGEGYTFAMAFLGVLSAKSPARMAVWDMPLPEFGTPLPLDDKPVAGLSVGPNGRIAIGRPEAVEIWNADKRTKERSIPAPKDSVVVVALSQDGSLLLAGGKDKTVRVWETATGKPLAHALKQPGEISGLSMMPDGATVAVTASGDGTVTMWDYKSGELKAVSFNEAGGQAFMAVGRKSPLLFRGNTGGVRITNDSSTRNKGVITAIDPATGLKARDFAATRGLVRGLALAMDDKTLAVVSGDKLGGEETQFFDTATGKETHHFPGDSELIAALAYTPDGKRLAVSTDGSIKFLDTTSGQLLFAIPQSAGRLAFNPEGTRLVTVLSNKVLLYDTAPPTTPRPLPADETVAVGVDPPLPWKAEEDSFPKPARELLQKAEKLWEEKDNAAALLYVLRAAEGDSKNVDHYRRSIALYRQSLPLAGGKEPTAALTPWLPEKPMAGQCESRFGPNGTILFTTCTFGSRPHQLSIVGLRDAKEIDVAKAMPAEFYQEERNHAAPTPDGKRVFVLLSQMKDKKFTRWIECLAATDGKSTLRIDLAAWDDPRWGRGDSWLSVTGDGKYVVLDELKDGEKEQPEEHFPGRTRAWDAATGKPLELPTKFHRLAFSPDGRFVLAAWLRSLGGREPEQPSVVYDLSTMKPVGAPIPLPPKVDFLELSRGGKYVVAREPGSKLTLRAYATADGRCTLAVKFRDKNQPYALTPDGERIAVPGPNYNGKNVIEVRETGTGNRKYTGTTLENQPHHIEMSPDGRFMLVRLWNGTVQLVDVDLVEPVGPPLTVTHSHGDNRPMVADRNMAFLDGSTFVFRAPFTKENYLKQTRFHMFDIQSRELDLADARKRAELVAGRFINEAGELEAIAPEDYKKRWAAAKADWIAAGAEEPGKVPGPPVVAGREPTKPPRPKLKPDCAAIFSKHGGADKPPLVSVADALNGTAQSNRLAALNHMIFTRPEDRLTLDLLVEGLKDDGCRDEMLKKFEELGTKAAPVVDALLVEFDLEMKHDKPQKTLVRALGKIGAPAKAAVPAMKAFLGTFGPTSFSDVEEETVRALGRMGPAAKEALPELVAKLPKYRQTANSALLGKALERICDGDYGPLVPLLETLLAKREDPDDWRGGAERERLCEFIGGKGRAMEAMAPALRKALGEPPAKKLDHSLKVALAQALWKVTGDATEALSVLEGELKRQGGGWPTNAITVAGRAAETLGRIGEPAKRTLPAIEELLKKPRNLHDRIALAEAAWRLGGKHDELLAACKARLEGREGYGGEEWDKVAAIGLLGELGPAAKDMTPLLQRLAKDEADADSKKVFRMTILRSDEEDPDPNTDSQFRDAVKAALERIEPEGK